MLLASAMHQGEPGTVGHDGLTGIVLGLLTVSCRPISSFKSAMIACPSGTFTAVVGFLWRSRCPLQSLLSCLSALTSLIDSGNSFGPEGVAMLSAALQASGAPLHQLVLGSCVVEGGQLAPIIGASTALEYLELVRSIPKP